MYSRFLVLLFTLAIALPGAVHATNSTNLEGYTIHHNVLTTDALNPQVAKRYNIRRSGNRGMLNVSVIKDAKVGIGTPVAARVKVTARNLTGQPRDIKMREIREGKAIYYIADFAVSNQEIMNFEIQVQPAGHSSILTAKLSHKFYTGG